MQTLESQFPPIAQALGRLRQSRLSPASAQTGQAGPFEDRPAANLEHAPNDFLRIVPEPALTADLPETRTGTRATPVPEEHTLRALEVLALAPVNRTFWCDL